VAAGSDEFSGLAGKYSETWTITGVTDGGELHGTIEIGTVTRHGAKYLLVAALGMLIGAAAAGAAIYYNPFTMTNAAKLDVADRTLHYSLPSEVLGFALGASRAAALRSATSRSGKETIDRTAMLSLVLDDAHATTRPRSRAACSRSRRAPTSYCPACA
jgi:hypothetical protein